MTQCYTPTVRRASSRRMVVPPVTSPSPPLPSLADATPAMRQYLDVKRQHRDAIVLFRMGDFYEMFYEDAVTAARALELTLTSRAKDASGAAIPMCGVPFHALETYLARLVSKGYRVAICDQVEDPAQGQGHRPARSHPRRLAGHLHRCVVPRCEANRRFSRQWHRRPAPRPLGASRFSTSRPASSRRRSSADRVRRPPVRPNWRCCGRRSCLPPSPVESTRR